MDRMNAKELNAISGALWHTVYDNWATARKCYDVRMDDLGDYYASTLPAIQSAYAKLMNQSWDPTPVDEEPPGMDDDDWNNGETYHEPLSYYIDA